MSSMSSLAMCQCLSGIWKRLATTLRWAPARRRWCETVLTDLMLEGLAMDAMDSVWQLIPELAAWRERPLIVVMKPLPASLPVAFAGDAQADCLLVSLQLSSRRRDAAVLRVMAYLLLEEHARLCSPPARRGESSIRFRQLRAGRRHRSWTSRRRGTDTDVRTLVRTKPYKRREAMGSLCVSGRMVS